MKRRVTSNMSHIVKILGVSAMLLGLNFSELTGAETSDILVNTTVIWETPAAGLIQTSNPFTPLCQHEDSTYYVWVDASNRPWVTKVTAGTPTTVPLDPNPDYKVQADVNHRFSMGIDKNGYIHITGDMHDYTPSTTGEITPYPTRYQSQTMLYWKSFQPASILEGFMFAGGLNSPSDMPGSGWTSGRFFKDVNGELFYSSEIHAIEASSAPGMLGVGLYRYDADNFVWTALGAPVPNTRAGTYNNVVFWDNSGFSTTGWSQTYLAAIKFDAQNRLHLAVSCNTAPTYAGNNRIVYAVSDDSGLTWSKANGIAIPGLPIQGAQGAANMGDIVSDVGTTTKLFGGETGLIVDKNGQQAVFVDNSCYVWNGTIWTNANTQNVPTFPSALYGYLDANNDLVFTFPSTGKIARLDSLDDQAAGYDFNSKYTSYVCVDEDTLRNSGDLYGVGLGSKTKVQSILKTTAGRFPLPDGWNNTDISPTALRFSGTAGYNNGYFNITDYGTVIDNDQDSFHYVYKQMTGDGMITSRVNTSLASSDGYSRAGIMMRARLSPNSQHASMIIAPGNKNKGALFTTRAISSGQTSNIAGGVVPGTYWTRLVRSGNTFTGYISADGVSWTLVSSSMISMPNTIYVGLAAASYANQQLMQTAKFDQVVTLP